MKSKLLTAVIAAAFMTVSGASWAYVGGNTIVKYPNADASKNKKVVNHGVGGNSAPSYPATPGRRIGRWSTTVWAATARRRTRRPASNPAL